MRSSPARAALQGVKSGAPATGSWASAGAPSTAQPTRKIHDQQKTSNSTMVWMQGKSVSSNFT